MAKSATLRAGDWRAILRLAGECRDLGDDRDAWRMHLLERMAPLVGSDVGFCVELGGLRAGRPRDLGYADLGFEDASIRARQAEIYRRADEDPSLRFAMQRYFERAVGEDGLACSRREVVEDREWYRSTAYHDHHRALGMDHALWCFRGIAADPGGDAMSGLFFYREAGRRDFSARQLALVREAQAALTPMIGGPLARFSEPSPADLTPTARRVLACLLEGDGDKQVAKRLRLSAYTVNDYTKRIYRHFGVRSRSELLARWVRRGWGRPPARIEP